MASDVLTSAFPRFARNVGGRDFAVGDIHGSFSHLSRSLEAIGFDPSVDRLFSVGDLVDRGPESHQVLAWLGKPWFHAILGNHDFMAFSSALGLPSAIVEYPQVWGEWLARLSNARQHLIGEALAALPLAMEIETASGIVGLVHADCPFDDWSDMAVQWDEVDPRGSFADCCLWSDERHARSYAGQVKNVRAIVHGHLVVSSPEILGNVHFIDTGGWKSGGHFTFLELESLQPVSGPVLAGAAVPPATSNRRIHSTISKEYEAQTNDGFGRCAAYAIVGARVLSLLTEHAYEAVAGSEIIDCGTGGPVLVSPGRQARRAAKTLADLSHYHCWIEARHGLADGSIRQEVVDFTVRHDHLVAKTLGISFTREHDDRFLWEWCDELHETFPEAFRQHPALKGKKHLWMWAEKDCTRLLRHYEEVMPAHFGKLTSAALAEFADRVEAAATGVERQEAVAPITA